MSCNFLNLKAHGMITIESMIILTIILFVYYNENFSLNLDRNRIMSLVNHACLDTSIYLTIWLKI